MKKLLSFLLSIIFVFSVLAPAALAEAAENRDEILSQAFSYVFPTDRQRDPQAALELLLPLAEAGDAEAQYYCGWIYDFELVENMETEAEAYKWYELAAKQGYVKAYIGAALNTFAEKYEEYLNTASELGFWAMSDDELGPDGFYWLAFMYYSGFWVEENPETAFIYYSAAAEMNSPLAMYDLGFLYDSGTGVEWDTELARMWYRSAADLGYAPAMRALAYSYYFRTDTDDGYQQAFDLFSTAAELGDAESMTQLGMMYQSGEGTEENNELAFEWYSKAVVLGDTHAMCMLGHMYRDGIYVEEDDNMAMELFIDAAVNGNISAPYVVEMMIACNEGLEKYNERAAEYKAHTAG